MSEATKSFIELAIDGDVTLDELDDFIDAWHEGAGGGELHEFLGMTEGEYALWMRTPGMLPRIIAARIAGVPLKELASSADQGLRTAARSIRK